MILDIPSFVAAGLISGKLDSEKWLLFMAPEFITLALSSQSLLVTSSGSSTPSP